MGEEECVAKAVEPPLGEHAQRGRIDAAQHVALRIGELAGPPEEERSPLIRGV